MHNILKLLLLFSLVGLFPACSPSDRAEWIRHNDRATQTPSRAASPVSSTLEWTRHNGWSTQTRFSSWSVSMLPTGLFVGFVRPEHRDIHPNQRTAPITKFNIQAGVPFTTLLILKSGYNEPYPVLLSIFLDYEQVSFSLDGQQGTLHYLEIKPGVDMEIPLEVPVKTSGWHDLFVVAFRRPDYHPTDQQERLPPKLAVGGLRTVICAGDCQALAPALPEALIGQGTDAHNSDVAAFPLLPDDNSPPQRRLLLSANTLPGKAFAMELWARNPSNKPRDYLVLPLLDFRQTLFAGSKVLHLRMPPGSELFVPGNIQVPTERGVHELQFISIFDAYRDLEEVTDPTVESVMRSALVVEDRQ